MTKKKLKKMTTRIIKIPIYGRKLRIDILDHPSESKVWKAIFICENPKCPHKCGCRPKINFRGFTGDYKDGIVIILRRTCGDKQCTAPGCGGINPETIAHEALHASYMILCNAGWKPDPKNHEPQAYLVSWIVREVYKAVKQDES